MVLCLPGKTRRTNTKNNGTNITTIIDEASVPPITEIPSAFCAPEPALDAIAKGNTPQINAIDVINIGRKRLTDPEITR